MPAVKLPTILLAALLIQACTAKRADTDAHEQSATAEAIDPVPGLAERMRDVIQAYDQVLTDSFCIAGPVGMRTVFLRYRCRFDSSVVVPGKYIPEDTTQSFRTHSFLQEVFVVEGRDTNLSRTVSITDLNAVLPDELRDAAVLGPASFEGADPQTGALRFGATVAIPLTDLGVQLRYRIGTTGRVDALPDD